MASWQRDTQGPRSVPDAVGTFERPGLIIALALFISAFSVTACNSDTPPPPELPYITAGKRLAALHCASCHLQPDPEDLPRLIWATEVLPLMGAFMGVYSIESRSAYLGGPEQSRYLEHVFPLEATIDSADWAALQTYYVGAAPDELPGSTAPAPQPLEQFDIHRVYDPEQSDAPSLTTVVRVLEGGGTYAGGKAGNGGQLLLFDFDDAVVGRFALSSPPTSVFYDRVLVVTEIGSLEPTDAPSGRLSMRNAVAWETAADSLLRPLDALLIALDTDAPPALVIAEYGNYHGRLSGIDTEGQKSVLVPTPGALRLKKADMDDDGHDDLVVLFAQGDERIEIFYARPGGPERRRAYRFPATYGSSDLEVVDFDGDGDLDLLTTNGDNFDYKPVPKPYHGIRLLANDGAQNFTEAWFYPLDGAYGLEVDDFDGDGDQDVAAIAYFVPPASRTTHSFVYLRRDGALDFTPFGFEKPAAEHYLCLAKGDTDGDGDQDLVLGNFSAYLPDGYGRQNTPGASPIYLRLENLSVR